MQTLKQVIAEAEASKKAIGHFNISDTEGFTAIVNAARELSVPVIIGVSEGERDFIGLKRAVALVRSAREEYGMPIFTNADHTYSLDKVREAIDLGVDSVIFDGTKMSFEENVSGAKEAVAYAASKSPEILVEGELGYIGSSSKVLDEIPEGAQITEDTMTTPEEAKDFIQKTGVHLLAPAVGNLHGILKNAKNPNLDIERVRQIREASGVPLVLHGGSGISDEDFRNAIDAGVSIVHVNTELRLAYRDAIKKSLEEKPDEVAPYRFLGPGVEAMQKVVLEKLKLFSGL